LTSCFEVFYDVKQINTGDQLFIDFLNFDRWFEIEIDSKTLTDLIIAYLPDFQL